MPDPAGFAHLHAAHREVARLREELARGPRQIKARRKAVAAKEAEVQTLREKLTKLKKTADEKNLQLRGNEEKIEKLKVNLNQASDNTVFATLKNQIAADQAANAVLEDAILETLDRADGAAEEVKTAEADAAKRSDDADAFAKEVAGRQAGLEERLAAAEGVLAEAEKTVPAGVAGDYKRLVAAHGADALSPVRRVNTKPICTACNTLLNKQQYVSLNLGKTLFCRNCGRLLYEGEDDS